MDYEQTETWKRRVIFDTFLTFLLFIISILWQKAKQYYNYGEDEEFQCFTGFELEGFQFINCLPDGTWSQPIGKCISMFL